MEEILNKEKLNSLIARTEKPTRYMGGELNMRMKEGAEFRFALCFPDTYEIGNEVPLSFTAYPIPPSKQWHIPSTFRLPLRV